MKAVPHSIRVVTTAAVVWLATGCAEPNTAPLPVADLEFTLPAGVRAPARPAPVAGYVAEGDQTPPPDLPPDFGSGLTELTVTADADFLVDGGMNRTAYGQGVVSRNSTNAFGTVELKVLQGYSELAKKTGESSRSTFLMSREGLFPTTTISVADDCGLTADAHAYGKVWNQIPLDGGKLFQWGEKSDTDDKTKTQPACSGGGGGTGGGGGDQHLVCYYKFFYDPITGEYTGEYELLFCELE